MRTGDNPALALPRPEKPLGHRVIVPVYIPALEGFYAHALEVLGMCLDSLKHTTRGRAAITVVSNGSAAPVVEALERYWRQGTIDQLVINRENPGKVDAAVAVARGAYEALITIADCDVLFRPGWIEAIEKIFRTFPECGVASPVPNPGEQCHWYYTSATMVDALFRNELRFATVVPERDLDRFAHSIGRPDFYSPDARSAQLIVCRDGVMACVGCGHFVMTLRRDTIQRLPVGPSLTLYKAEEVWVDAPPDKMGYWRLAATEAYAWHMGNLPEPWMHDELLRSAGGAEEIGSAATQIPLGNGRPSRLPWVLRRLLVRLMRRAGFIRPTSRWLNAAGTSPSIGATANASGHANSARVP